MTSNCHSYAIFMHFPPDFIFLIMAKSNHIIYFFSPGATTPNGGCILQPSSGL